MTLVLLASLSAGVLQDQQGNVLSKRQVNVYSRGTSTPVQVYADSAGLSPVTQPLTTDSSGQVPGYVAGASVDLVDVLSGARLQAEPVSANSVAAVSADAVRFISATNGNDTNNGKAWGSAHQTLAHAVADLPTGGLIYVAPGNYVQSATLTMNGHTLIGLGHGSGNATVPVIQHNFNGDLFSFTPGSQGGGLHNLFLNQSSNGLTGSAIKAASTVGTASGYLYFSNLVFTGSTGFERNVYLDGTANAIGIRSVFFDNCLFFGTFLTSQNASEAAACSENVRVDAGAHVYFTACDIVQAPAAQTQALKLYGTFTEDVFWSGKILGNLYSQAGASGSAAGSQSVLAEARITGAVTFETSSSGHRVIGGIEGTVLNNGDASNVTDKQPWIAAASLLQNSWVNTGGGNNPAGYYRGPTGIIYLRGRLSSGTTTANTTLFQLPLGFRPNGTTCNFLVFAQNQPGVLTPCWLTILSNGTVSFQTSLAGSGTSQSISLDGVSFSVN